MITLKGAEVSAKIKEQVLSMNQELNGYVPTAAIVRIGERPDDLSYERNVMKRIAAYGMEAKSFAYPADISEEEFFAEFQKINDDETIRPELQWRSHANNLYTNWLNYYVYQSTPYDLYGTPDFREI